MSTTTQDTSQFNLDAIGQWGDPVSFPVERDRNKA